MTPEEENRRILEIKLRIQEIKKKIREHKPKKKDLKAEEPETYSLNLDKYLGTLIRQGFIEALENTEIHLESYGTFDIECYNNFNLDEEN